MGGQPSAATAADAIPAAAAPLRIPAAATTADTGATVAAAPARPIVLKQLSSAATDNMDK